MPDFAGGELTRLRPLWEAMLEHPFLRDIRAGTLPESVFTRWLAQDYLFAGHSVGVLGALLARAPGRHRDLLLDALEAYREELRLFADQAARLGVSLEAAPGLVTHAYTQFLTATALGGSYAEGFTALFVLERAYYDAWRHVQEGLSSASPWSAFVQRWASEEFGAYVGRLERELDALAAEAGPEERASLSRVFELTVRYEIAFWEMALTGATWPGAGDA
jgi:thiaminase/transcriptional activator TenA